MNIITILALAAALLAPLLTYLGVVRKLSGRVKTSDASQLWTESRSIREDLRSENARLSGRIDRLEELVAGLAEKNDHLRQENEALRRLVEAHEETIATLKRENAALKARVEELEAHGYS